MADFGNAPTIGVQRPVPGVAVLVLTGEHDLASARELDRVFADVLSGAKHVVVDLSEASFIDSYTMGTIIHARRAADAANCRFNVVVPASSVIARALDIAEVLPLLNGVRS